MAGAQVELWPKNPPKNQLAAYGGAYTVVRIERAADVGGAPGAFAEIGTTPIDASDEATYYRDDAGDDTAWYRYRFSDNANLIQSQRSDYIQAGDSIVRQDIRAEIPDLDITVAMWDRWGRYVLSDLFIHGIWKEDDGEIDITTTNGVADERYNVPAHIRDVYRVEIRDDGGHIQDTLTDPEDVVYTPGARTIRFPDASTSSSDHYWVVGKAQYRAYGELTDDFYVLALHMLLVRYLQYRKRQRANWKKFITFDPTTDINVTDIDRMIQEEKQEVGDRVAKLAMGEPAIPIPE